MPAPAATFTAAPPSAAAPVAVTLSLAVGVMRTLKLVPAAKAIGPVIASAVPTVEPFSAG